MTSVDTSKGKRNHKELYLFSAYYLVIVLFLLTSFFPEGRVWGVNWWAYLPALAKYSLLLLGIATPLAVSYWSRRLRQDGSPTGGADQKSTGYLVPVSLTIVLFGLAFVVFRGTTHFLGDGYQLLSRLADRVPSVKAWDMGTSFINDSLFSLLSGQPDARALLTFQIISVASGVALLIAVAFLSRVLFEHNLHRYLFFLGLASGGYMLLFFGYVENYALFIAAMMLYTLVGLLVAKGKASRWWALPPLLVTLFLHLFGVTLLPSLLYLLFRDSRFGRRLGHLSTKTKLLIAAGLVLLSGLIYYYLYTSYYFFTFALLPMVPDRFTIEGDWLFSFKHIYDIGNLLMLLVPGLPIFLTMVFVSPVKGWLRRAEYRFLLILAFSTLGAVYVFNPGIGMPRNWDLFSIAGVPLAVLCYYYALERRRSGRSALVVCVPAIVLGFLSLAPRVATQVVPDLGIAHFKNYLVLDKIRNRNARRLLVDYYKRAGNATAAQKEQARTEADFPEAFHNRKARELISQANYAEAIVHLRRALEFNPLSYDAYGNLGVCYLNQDVLDSALVLLKIADGLNPYNASTINNMGTACLRKGEYARAERLFLKSLRIDSTGQNAMVGLASVYLSLNQFDRSLDYVTKVYTLTEMPYEYFRQAGDAYLDKRAFRQAARAYHYAIKRGLDPAYVKDLQKKFP